MHRERQRRELCRGVWGYIFQKLFKTRVSKMAILSILRLISYSFNTHFLLVNFAIVKKKNYKKGASIDPPAPPPGSATANSRASSIVHALMFEFG